MSQQKRTIMGACDYSIETLRNLKKDLSDTSHPNHEINWAYGGLVTALVSKLIQACGCVFEESCQTAEPNALRDLLEIQSRFNEFVTNMINGAT